MATKYSGRWCIDGASESIALFSDKVSLAALQGWVDSIWENHGDLDWVDVIDMDTGEVVADRYSFDEVGDDDWDGDYWDGGCSIGNEDCGFDPYLGCYTDDC